MEGKKYSSGTKGRLKKHSDNCKELIHERCGDFHLAVEYIDMLDPADDPQLWQRYQEPKDCLPEVDAWLAGAETAPAKAAPDFLDAIPQTTPELPHSDLPTDLQSPTVSLVMALTRTRDWLKGAEANSALKNCSPQEAMDKVLTRLLDELSPPTKSGK